MGELIIAEHTLGAIGIDNIMPAIRRHLKCNWGDVTANEKITNEQAVKGEGNIVSVHKTEDGKRFVNR